MANTTYPLTDLDAVDRLGADLAAARYNADGVPDLLGADAHNALGRGYRWPALAVTGRAAADGSALATVTRLFLFGTAEPADAVAAALPSLGVPGGLACGALERAADDHAGPDRIRAAVGIRPHADEAHQYLVASDFDAEDRPGPLPSDHVPGIGAASMTLARAVVRRPVGRVLDLGTGCGIQALHCAAHAQAVTATDTNPRALALATATARLNGQRWDLRQGSLFAPVASERFDLIVANPPFVISTGARRFAYRDSGVAGDGLCRTLVTQVADHLADGGTAQILANWMIVADTDWRLRIGEWVAATGCDGWVVQRDVARPAEYVALWLADTGEEAGPEAESLAGEWIDYFAQERVSGIGMGTITLRRRGGNRGRTPDVVFDELTGAGDELTGPEVDGFLARRAWLEARSDEELVDTALSLAAGDLLEQRSVPSADGWAPILRMLYRTGGPGASVQLDDWGQALLAGCTGEVPLRTQIRLLAAAHGVDEAALTEAVLPTIRTAVTRGLLHPVDQ